ncbi:MAG: GNAT family N-acetyltransferase [Actinomycetota bacterium]
MDITLRPIEADEVGRYLREIERAFGESMSDEDVERYAPTVELDRTLIACEGDRWVATSGARTQELTVPGGALVGNAGVTAVGVRPTHRRRGILTTMMDRLHADARERGEPTAALLASEAGIYGRFGYGIGTEYRSVVLESARTALPEVPHGRVELVEAAEAESLVLDVFDRARRARPGQVTRSVGWAERLLADRESDRDGAGPLEVSVSHDADGVVDGVALWRLKPDWAMNQPGGTVVVVELIATTDAARVRLHGHLLTIDLTTSVRLDRADLGDPTPFALTDARAYRTVARGDWLWVRVLDPAAALAARSYEHEDRLVIEVHDREEVTTVALDAGVEASCSITTEEPDLVCPASTLGSLLLGGVRPSALATIGRLQGDVDAVRRADRVFPTALPPFCQTMF